MGDEAGEEAEVVETTVPEMWLLAKPPVDGADGEEDEEKKKIFAGGPGPKVGKLVKYLNDIEDAEELETKVAERDPATGQSLLMWATLTGRFVLVEWLVKKTKRAAFAFSNKDNELTVFDKHVEVQKEMDAEAAEPKEEEEAAEDEEEEKPEPDSKDKRVFDGLAEFHEQWGDRGDCIVKTIGHLGIYQGARDAAGTKVGLGQTLFPNGDMYCGEYKDNQRDGQGVYYYAGDGMIYCGGWKNDRRHGIGRFVLTDGSRYYGAFVADKKEGEGRYTYPDGSTYTGRWVNDVKHGHGTYTFADGSQYSGCFINGNFVSGEWKLAGGTKYVGSFENGLPKGKGVFTFKVGQEGSYRQEGVYERGQWQPGAVVPVSTLPSLDVVIQRKTVSASFGDECAGLTTEDLVRCLNFGAFQDWLAAVESNPGAVFIDAVTIVGVRFDDSRSRGVKELRLKVVARGPDGARLKGTDCLILKAPTTRLLVLLVAGEGAEAKTMAAVQRSPAVNIQAAEQLRLPEVTVGPTGKLQGSFVDIVTPTLRVDLTAANTMPLPLTLGGDPASGAAAQTLLLYVQAVHPDTLTTAQARLDAACAGKHGFDGVRCVRVADVATTATDATTAIAAHHVVRMLATGQLPGATVAPQRPPTPIPPAIEPRPDIEPLLEAERAKQKKAEDAEEDA